MWSYDVDIIKSKYDNKNRIHLIKRSSCDYRLQPYQEWISVIRSILQQQFEVDLSEGKYDTD